MQVPISEADFAFSLGKKLLAEDSDENFVYSPLSVCSLAALVNATDEASKPALLEAMVRGSNRDQLNEYAQTLLIPHYSEKSIKNTIPL